MGTMIMPGRHKLLIRQGDAAVAKGRQEVTHVTH